MPKNRWAALAVLSLSLVVVTLDTTVLNTALPSIARDLHASTAQLQWIVDAYTLVFAALMLVAGALGVRFGPRRAFVAGLGVFAVGSVGAGLATGPGALIAARAVMGIGAALVMPATLAIILALFHGPDRPKALGLWSATAGVGVVLGPIVGGTLLERFSWPSVFWINVPLILAAVMASLRLVPAVPGRAAGRTDAFGALTSTAGLALAVDAVIRAPERGWTAAVTLVESAAAAVILAAFIAWQLRAKAPMLDVRMFARGSFRVASAMLAVTFFALFGALFVLTQYLQLVQGYSPLRAGFAATPFAASMAATAAASSVLAVRVGARLTIALGLTAMAVGLGGLALVSPTTPFAYLAVTMMITGAGMGLVMAPASEVTLASVSPAAAAGVPSVNGVVRELGGTLGIAVVGSIVSGGYHHAANAAPSLARLPGAAHVATEDIAAARAVAEQAPAALRPEILDAASTAFVHAMATGVWVSAAVALAGAAAALTWLPRRTRKTESPPATPAAAPEPVATPA
jgi:EmrB/QacA subfamily drug resistance transporter